MSTHCSKCFGLGHSEKNCNSKVAEQTREMNKTQTDYGKEPVTIIEKNDDWAVGDKVVINDYYLDHYLDMGKYKGVEAEVVKIVSRPIHFDKGKEDPMFLRKYGRREVYDLIGLYIRYPGETAQYLASPFGYDKVSP